MPPSSSLGKTLRAALGAFRNPENAALVAEVGERTGVPALRSILSRMRAHPTGRRILRDRPGAETLFGPKGTLARAKSAPEKAPVREPCGTGESGRSSAADTAETMYPKLSSIPDGPRAGVVRLLTAYEEGTLGHGYGVFLASHGFDPLGRDPVKHVPGAAAGDGIICAEDASLSEGRGEENPRVSGTPGTGVESELAYVMARYRQCHDFWHILSGLPTTVAGESAQKGLEFAQTGLPMALAAFAVGGKGMGLAIRPAVWGRAGAWAALQHTAFGKSDVMNVYYEELLSEDIDVVRRIAGVRPAPRIDGISGYDVYVK